MRLYRQTKLLRFGQLGVVAVVAVELQLQETHQLGELRHAERDEEHIGADRHQPAVLTDHPVGRGHQRGDDGEQHEDHDEGGLAAGGHGPAQLPVEPGRSGQNAEHEGTTEYDGQGENEDAHCFPFLVI